LATLIASFALHPTFSGRDDTMAHCGNTTESGQAAEEAYFMELTATDAS
jgi:hypothetical protein